MNADFAKYRNKKIFVDANAFIYHLIGVCRVSKEIFRLGEEEKLGLITTTRIIDEVIHKIVLIKAREKFGIVSKTMPKIRRDTEKVKIMAAETKPVFRLIQAIHLAIEGRFLLRSYENPGSHGGAGSHGKRCTDLHSHEQIQSKISAFSRFGLQSYRRHIRHCLPAGFFRNRLNLDVVGTGIDFDAEFFGNFHPPWIHHWATRRFSCRLCGRAAFRKTKPSCRKHRCPPGSWRI